MAFRLILIFSLFQQFYSEFSCIYAFAFLCMIFVAYIFRNISRKLYILYNDNINTLNTLLLWCHIIIWLYNNNYFQSLSHVWLFKTPWTAAYQASLSFTISWSLPKLVSTEVVMLYNYLVLCHPLLLLPSVFLSIRVFSNESALRIRWPKYWSFSFSISPSNEYSRLISFRIDWLELLAVHGTLKSIQHHSSKASVLQHSAFFMVQLSYPYMTTGKTIALTRQIFVGKMMSLLFNTLFQFIIAFFPRSKRLLISWLQSPSALILELPEIKSVTLFIVSPSICHDVIGLSVKPFFYSPLVLPSLRGSLVSPHLLP